ncbi:carboxypeptidase-like regulatory domain-containing protein [Puia sp.]|uniref:carboxypeptidase-like regulatory domain-containing protein n=1 Tax=Puia sp. TaxID=2045100 RepID=UPI002F424B90
MKKPIVSLTLLLILLAGFLACQKYSSSGNSTTTGNNIPPEVMVTANVQGRVVDQDGTPVQGAAVTSGTASATTDVNGIFTFTNISMSSRFGYVQATKSGYFAGSRSIVTNGGESGFITIRLIGRSETGSFLASTGGKVMVYSGDTVAFGPTSVVTASDNTAYTGTVHVFATYLNPTNENAFQYMPGDLRGIGSDGKETAIQSFGMMEVELRDDAGNKLQIASGQTATLTMAIPTSLQATAPATIPLWYFNDSTGRWIQQGTATRQGNNYVGQVGHFTWWNCDSPLNTVNFKIQVKDQYGNSLPHNFISFTSPTGDVRGGYTDLNGYASGLILKGKPLVMQVVTECGNIMGGMNVGPALQDVDLGTLKVTVTSSDLTLSGKVVDCSNNPVDSGMVDIMVDGLDHRAAVKQGAFTLPIIRCYSTTVPVMITATDFTAQQSGTASTINASSGQVDAGQLSACGVSYTQFITVTANGNTWTWTTPPNSITYSAQNVTIGSTPGTYNSFDATDGNNSSVTLSTYNLTGTGQYALNFLMYAPNSNWSYGSSVQLNVTNYGAVNGYITGTLSGNLKDTMLNQSYPVTGSIKVLRTQ